MKNDPFTVRIALDNDGAARGELYLDDGESFSHRRGDIVWREFRAESSKKGKVLRIASEDLAKQRPSDAVDGVALGEYNSGNEFAASISKVRVEKLVVLGLGSKPVSVRMDSGAELQWEYSAGVPASGKKEGSASILTIRDPDVAVVADWALVVE